MSEIHADLTQYDELIKEKMRKTSGGHAISVERIGTSRAFRIYLLSEDDTIMCGVALRKEDYELPEEELVKLIDKHVAHFADMLNGVLKQARKPLDSFISIPPDLHFILTLTGEIIKEEHRD